MAIDQAHLILSDTWHDDPRVPSGENSPFDYSFPGAADINNE